MKVVYEEKDGRGTVLVEGARLEQSFKPDRIDEAHILYMEASEILKSRLALGESEDSIRSVLERLFALYRPKV